MADLRSALMMLCCTVRRYLVAVMNVACDEPRTRPLSLGCLLS